MKTLTALFLLASLFINDLFADYPAAIDQKQDSLVLKSDFGIPVDSIIDIDSLLNDTTLFKLVSDSVIIDFDSLKTDTISGSDTICVTKSDSIASMSDSIIEKKPDTIVKPIIPKKPVVIIPQSVLDLRKIYSDYRKYSDWAQDRWDDIYLSLSEIQMKSDYYKFVVPLTYYSKAFEEASTIE